MTNGTTTDVARDPRTRVPSAPPGSTEPATRVATLSQALGPERPGGASKPQARPRGGEAALTEPARASTPPGRTRDTGISPGTTGRAPEPADAAGTVPPAFRQRTGRGRHRRPRPRRALFAVGGLALAAGALSLARMAPDGVTGSGGGAEAEPRPAVADDGALDASPTVWAVPSAHPATAGAAAARGGAGATPTTGASPGATASTGPAGATGAAGVTDPSATAPPGAHPPGRAGAPAADPPDTTGIPTAPVPSQPPAAPAPHPTPSGGTHAPAPKPGSPGLCVPIVGICVDGLANPLGHG
ncbi:hypothetical protein [Streptomyces sp. NPDC088358]|uniref:hypothetical protein n=1 Tax=Streptomyces sp. NPDC088358 TaxID=3365857 RepID=UPI0037FE8C4E